MSDEQNELTREELEDQDGEHLPPREVMSTIDPESVLLDIPVKHYEVSIDDPRPSET